MKGYVKQKILVLMIKQKRIFARIGANALKSQKYNKFRLQSHKIFHPKKKKKKSNGLVGCECQIIK